MSHKTGKRVLTASTSLALAVVGLAASPLSAQAAPVGTGSSLWVNGCGTNDYIAVTAEDNLNQLSIDGGATWTAVTYKAGVDANGDRMVDVSGLAIYDTSSASLNYHKVIRQVILSNQDGSTTVTASSVDASTKNVTDSPCTVSVGGAASGLAPSTGTLTGVVKAPTAAPNVGSNGGTVTLTNTLGIKWTVNDGVTTQTIASADIGAVGATKTVAVSGANVTVSASPEQATGVNLAPPSAFTWTFTLNGGVTVTAPNAPTFTASTNTATFTPSGADNFRWYVTDASVTTPGAAAATTPLSTTTGAYQFAAADAGKTKKIWAIPLQGFQFADGTTFKQWDINVPAGAGLVVDPAQFTFTDTATTDSVTVPAISGAKLYYSWVAAGPADPVAPTFNADGTIASGGAGWNSLPTGATTTLTTPGAGSTLFIVATPTAPGGSFAYRPGLWNPTAAPWASLASTAFPRAATIGLKSPAAYTTGAIAQVPYPAFNDVTGGANDSVTFPDFSTDVTWDVYAYPVGTATPTTGTAYKLTSTAVNSAMGTTKTRGQWGTLTTDVGSSSVDPNKDTVFQFVPTGAGGKSLPAGLDATRLQGTLYIAGGTTAPEPVWVDNSGTTAPDFIKFAQTAGVTYTYDVDADNNGLFTDAGDSTVNAATPYTNGISIKAVAAGSRVRVIASGTDLRNADPGSNGTTATFIHQFTTGNTGIVPAAPTQSDQPGADNDTYTIPTTGGVDYYVNNSLKAAGTYSTGGARSVTIIAVPQTGYTIAQGATASWTLPFETPNDLGDVAVGNEIITDADDPTTRYSWSADNATSYTVTYYKVLGNNQFGPELPWLTDTTETSANFVAMAGDEYIIKVVAEGANGQTKSASSGVKFPEDPNAPKIDINAGQGSFNSAWTILGKSALNGLPYYGDTAALGYTNAQWTQTLPAGNSKFDLYATVHDLGAKALIQVNGQNWAYAETNSSYWDEVSDPYSYPVRTISGWDSTKPVTIKVIAVDAGTKYLALDAFKAHN